MKSSINKYRPELEYFFKEGCFINELSNSEEDPAVSVARVRVEPGRTTRWHTLAGIAERYLILEGEGEVEVAQLSLQSVTAGDLVRIAPGDRQRIRNNGNSDLIFLAICTPRFVESAYSDAL